MTSSRSTDRNADQRTRGAGPRARGPRAGIDPSRQSLSTEARPEFPVRDCSAAGRPRAPVDRGRATERGRERDGPAGRGLARRDRDVRCSLESTASRTYPRRDDPLPRCRNHDTPSYPGPDRVSSLRGRRDAPPVCSRVRRSSDAPHPGSPTAAGGSCIHPCLRRRSGHRPGSRRTDTHSPGVNAARGRQSCRHLDAGQ